MTEEMYLYLESCGYKKKQIWQLLFLYQYLLNQNKQDIFENYLNELSVEYNFKQMQQIIKCITHNTPYKFLLQKDLSWKRMNELRRYLEDSLSNVTQGSKSYNEYVLIAENMISNHWKSDCIYELRRFVKGKHILSSSELLFLYNYLTEHNIVYWQVISFIYDIFNKGTYYLFDSLSYAEPILEKLINEESSLSLDHTLLVISKVFEKYFINDRMKIS